MEACFFNNCVLNESDSLNKYRKATNDKKVFKVYEVKPEDEELFKVVGIGTKTKKIVFCSRHQDLYSKYKRLYRIINQETLRREETINLFSDALELISIEPVFKKLLTQKIEVFPGFFNNYLFRYDIKVDSLILLFILYLMKETSIRKAYGLKLLDIVFGYYQNFVFDIKKTVDVVKLDRSQDYLNYQNYTTIIQIILEIVDIGFNENMAISQETSIIVIERSFKHLSHVLEMSTNSSILRTLSFKDYREINENLILFLISNIQAIFLNKDVKLDEKNIIVNESLRLFEEISRNTSTYSDKYLRISSLFYYEIIYFINTLTSEYLTEEKLKFMNEFKEYVKVNITSNKFLKSNYFLNKLPEMIDNFEKKQKYKEK